MSGSADTAPATAWRLLAGMIPLALLSQFYRSSTGVIAPDLAAELALTTEQIGLISGAFFVAIAVLQLPVGILLDRFGASRMIVALLGIAIAGSVAFAMGDGFGELVVARVLIATGFAAVTIGSVVILRKLLAPAELSIAIAILFAAANAGSLVATSPLATASAWLGWRETFVALGILSALCGLLFWTLTRDRSAREETSAARETLLQSATGVLDVLRIPEIRLVVPLIAVGYASVIAVVGLWGGPYLHEVHGLDTIARGNTLSVMAVALILGTLVYGPLEKRFGARRRLVTLGVLASALPLVLLALWPSPGVALATALLSLFALASGFSVVVMAHGMSLLPTRLAGRGATTLNIALLGGAAVIQSVTGTLLENLSRSTGAPAAYAILFACLAAVLLGALFCYRRIEQGVAPDAAIRAAE
jgi:predicted MFS family arabinose efflux permease